MTAEMSVRPVTVNNGDVLEFEGDVPFEMKDVQSIDIKFDFISKDDNAQVFVKKIELTAKNAPAKEKWQKFGDRLVWQKTRSYYWGAPVCIKRQFVNYPIREYSFGKSE